MDGDDTVVTPDTPVEVKQKLPTQIGGERGIKPGRRKGSKNKSTIVREALANDFEEELQKDFHKVIRAVIDQAIDGCRQSQKLLIDRIVPTVHAESDKEKNPFAGGVHITVSNMGTETSVSVSQDIEDAEYEDITDEEDNG
jgi:hypothetical protein